MNGDGPLFELPGPDLHVRRLYLNGRAVGIPPGTAVSNSALTSYARVVGEMKKQTVCLAAEQA